MSSMAWIFVKANEDFFTQTVGQKVDLIPKGLDVVRKTDTKDRLQLVHTRGLPFVELETGAWFQLDLSSGKLFGHFEGAQVRGDFGYTVLQSQRLRKRLTQWCKDEPPTFSSECCHAAVINPEGLRNKLEVLLFNTTGLSPEDSTQQLASCVIKGYENDEYHQFYSEDIEAFLKRGANPAAIDYLPAGMPSILMAVISNGSLRENIALRSAELLFEALKKRGHSLGDSERQALLGRVQSSSKDLRSRWEHLCSEL